MLILFNNSNSGSDNWDNQLSLWLLGAGAWGRNRDGSGTVRRIMSSTTKKDKPKKQKL